MRKNQIGITINRFDDQVPKELNTSQMTVIVYADANNVYEALVVPCKVQMSIKTK